MEVGAIGLSKPIQSAQEEGDVDDSIVRGEEAQVVVWKVFERILGFDLVFRDWRILVCPWKNGRGRAHTFPVGHSQPVKVFFWAHQSTYRSFVKMCIFPGLSSINCTFRSAGTVVWIPEVE
jgi:hypothetical protein